MTKISDAELEVMKVIWKKRKTTSWEIINQLKEYDWNDNTIRTLINRLIIKKAIGISKKVGRTYIYVALIPEKLYVKKRTQEFIQQIYNGSIRNLIFDFIEIGGLSKNELEKIVKLLKKKCNQIEEN